MAQIFLSHSQKDKDIAHFLLEAFSGTKVKPHLEEFEKGAPAGITAKKIEGDIQASNAVFVLLSENVENLKHTRDWVNWECGTVKNKDILVFEPLASLGKVSIIIPRFNHYILFEQNDIWRNYIRSVIESYDDSHVWPTLSTAAVSGAMINKTDRVTGAVVGAAVGLAGLILKDMTKQSFGIEVKCQKCLSNYKIHRYGTFRCAVCNASLILQQPQTIEHSSAAT